jgi:hypothetical protein
VASKVGCPFRLASKNFDDAVTKFHSVLFEEPEVVVCCRRVLLLSYLNDLPAVLNHFNFVLSSASPHLPTLLVGLSVIQHFNLSGVNNALLAQYLNDLREPGEGEEVAVETPLPELEEARLIGLL